MLDKTLCRQEQDESLEEALKLVNENIENLSPLTDFPIGVYICHLIMVYFSVCKHFCGILFVYIPNLSTLFQRLLSPCVFHSDSGSTEAKWLGEWMDVSHCVFVCRVSLSG